MTVPNSLNGSGPMPRMIGPANSIASRCSSITMSNMTRMPTVRSVL